MLSPRADYRMRCFIVRYCSAPRFGNPAGRGRIRGLPDHFVAAELCAGQVDHGSVWQEIPVVHALAAAVGAQHLGNQQFAPEQVMDRQRGGLALPAGRVGG